MHPKQHIHMLITGGTIDSIFDVTSDTTIVNDHSAIRGYIEEKIRPHFALTQEIITMKDSRQITDHVRADIVEAIIRVPHTNIVLTHGTYTLVATAQYLERNFEKFPDRKIVVMGSFYPLKGFSDSDAPFNLGFSIAAAIFNQPGVYVAMNGALFTPNQVAKNIKAGRFEFVTP